MGTLDSMYGAIAASEKSESSEGEASFDMMAGLKRSRLPQSLQI